jgi:hypothetical protein
MGSGVADRASSAAARFRVASSPAGLPGEKPPRGERRQAGTASPGAARRAGLLPSLLSPQPLGSQRTGRQDSDERLPAAGGGRLFVNKSHSDNRLHVTRGHLPAGARVVGG